MMNLHHRLADNTKVNFVDAVYHRIRYPLNIVLPLVVLVLSFYTIFPYFGTEGQTGTISAVFIPIFGKFIDAIFGGIESELLTNFVLVGYGIGALSWYLFIYSVTKRHLTAFLSALLVLLPSFPFSAEVPERLIHAIVERDGGHIVGLSITPFILYAFIRYLQKGNILYLLLTILGGLALGLLSFFATCVAFLFMSFITISEILIGSGRVKILRFGISLGLIILGLIILFNVALKLFIFSEAGGATVSIFLNLIPMLFFILPLFAIFTFLIFDRRPYLQPLFLSSSFAIVFGLLNFVGVFIVESEVFNKTRYASEASFAFAFIISFITTGIFDLLRAGFLIKRYPGLYRHRTEIAFSVTMVLLISLIGSILFVPRSI